MAFEADLAKFITFARVKMQTYLCGIDVAVNFNLWFRKFAIEVTSGQS